MGEAAGLVTVHGSEEVRALAGRVLGPSGWLVVDQERDDRFARAADDWHWAHNEPDRAATGPFGGPVAHGHLLLALLPHLFRQVLVFTDGECMFYGYDRVRLPTVCPVGGRVRLLAEVAAVDDVPGGEQLAVDVRIEVEDAERPACAARALWRLYHGM